jgi:hypothetical protein
MVKSQKMDPLKELESKNRDNPSCMMPIKKGTGGNGKAPMTEQEYTEASL